jgi:hypothetical protein
LRDQTSPVIQCRAAADTGQDDDQLNADLLAFIKG